MRFQPGEAVICINDDFTWAKRKYARFEITWPVRGRHYVVRKYVMGGSHPAIVLQGIVNPKVPYNDDVWREAGYHDQRFMRAPKVEGSETKNTSIDDLKKIAEQTAQWLPATVGFETEDA